MRFRVREHSDPQAYLTRGGMQLSSRDGVHLAGPDAAAALRDVKAGHYRAWVGQPVPMLGGLSPREAARGKPKDRRALELLLAEIENLEARSAEAERFDVRLLRRELGLTASQVVRHSSVRPSGRRGCHSHLRQEFPGAPARTVSGHEKQPGR